MPFAEYQMVRLSSDVAGLSAGTVGVIVGVYGNGGYEVEVLSDGRTVAVLTVAEAEHRRRDIPATPSEPHNEGRFDTPDPSRANGGVVLPSAVGNVSPRLPGRLRHLHMFATSSTGAFARSNGWPLARNLKPRRERQQLPKPVAGRRGSRM